MKVESPIKVIKNTYTSIDNEAIQSGLNPGQIAMGNINGKLRLIGNIKDPDSPIVAETKYVKYLDNKNDDGFISVEELYNLNDISKCNIIKVAQIIQMQSRETPLNTLIRLGDFGVFDNTTYYMLLYFGATNAFICKRKKAGTPTGTSDVSNYWELSALSPDAVFTQGVFIQNTDKITEDEDMHVWPNQIICKNDTLKTAIWQPYSEVININNYNIIDFLKSKNNNYFGNILLQNDDPWTVSSHTIISPELNLSVTTQGSNTLKVQLPKNFATLMSSAYFSVNVSCSDYSLFSDAIAGSAIAVFSKTDNCIYVKHDISTAVSMGTQFVIHVFLK